MSSGRKALRQNTRERLVSTDFNRAEAFAAGFANEVMREAMLAPVDDSLYVGTTFKAPGAVSSALDVLVPGAPDYGGVLNGLMVVVPAGGTTLLITSGMLMLIDPEGAAGSSDPTPLNPDDGPGPARVVFSAGITDITALPWTPNAGPGTRVDIVECQRTNVVSETDNRDIFNPATGLFTPQAVTKVTVGDLTFRIRLGVAGGGLPAPALGWFPLAVMATAAASPNLDTVTVWDVRNLLSDLASPNATIRSIYPRVRRYGFTCLSSGGVLTLSGESVGDYNGYKIGGIFYEPSVPGSTNVVVSSAFYLAAGFVPIPSLPYYLYALLPPGYVRWVRYYGAAVPGLGGRGPGMFRGILTLSQIPPLLGQPSAAIGLPTPWGLNVSTVFGQMLASGTVDGGAFAHGFIGDGETIKHETFSSAWQVVAAFSITNPAGPSSLVNFILTPGVNYPAGAKRVRVRCRAIMTGAVGTVNVEIKSRMDVVVVAGAVPIAEAGITPNRTVTATGAATVLEEEFTLPVGADGIAVPPALGFQWSIDQFDAGTLPFPQTVLASSLVVTGWDQ